jgi:hypothetical protein
MPTNAKCVVFTPDAPETKKENVVVKNSAWKTLPVIEVASMEDLMKRLADEGFVLGWASGQLCRKIAPAFSLPTEPVDVALVQNNAGRRLLRFGGQGRLQATDSGNGDGGATGLQSEGTARQPGQVVDLHRHGAGGGRWQAVDPADSCGHERPAFGRRRVQGNERDEGVLAVQALAEYLSNQPAMSSDLWRVFPI